MEMKWVLLVMFIFLMSSVTATTYTVNVYDGVGAGDGDQNDYVAQEDDGEDDGNEDGEDGVDVYKELKNSVYLKEGIIISKDKIIISSNSISAKEGTAVTDTAKEPINYTPYIIWGSIILVLLILIGGFVYIYQIYFY